MTPDLEALGRRAADKLLEKMWRPGIRLVCEDWSGILLSYDGLFWKVWADGAARDYYSSYHDPIPDLSDAPTRGAVLELAREAWKDPHACVIVLHWNADGTPHVWGVVSSGGSILSRGATEIEAMIVALEAAP